MTTFIKLEGDAEAHNILIGPPQLTNTEAVRLAGLRCVVRDIKFTNQSGYTGGAVHVTGDLCVVDRVTGPSTTTTRALVFLDGANGTSLSNIVEGTPPI